MDTREKTPPFFAACVCLCLDDSFLDAPSPLKALSKQAVSCVSEARLIALDDGEEVEEGEEEEEDEDDE